MHRAISLVENTGSFAKVELPVFFLLRKVR
nr:MAG TPA: hypothetical protein [Caudoviricetes sp.]